MPDERLAEVCRQFAVSRLELFGSSARGDFSAGSDVDLLVEFVPGARVGLIRLSSLHIALEALLQCRVDLVPRSGLKLAIRDEVLGEARVIFTQ